MTEQLKTFWTFDDANLTQNRKSQLSEKQKMILDGEHKAQKRVFLGVGGFVVLLFLCVPTLIVGSRVVLPAILSENLSGADFLPPDMGFAIVLAFMIPVLAVDQQEGRCERQAYRRKSRLCLGHKARPHTQQQRTKLSRCSCASSFPRR